MGEPWILGVSYSHNGAACLIRGDELVVAIQEERLTGVKRAPITHAFQSLAVSYCLHHAGISRADLELLVTCEFSGTATEPASTNHLTIPHHLGHAHAVVAMSGWHDAAVLIVDGQGGDVAMLPDRERTPLRHGVVPGGVRQAEVASIYHADRGDIALVEKHTGDAIPSLRDPNDRRPGGSRPPRSLQQFGSLGGMYMAVSGLVFDDWMQAGKVMGLAPYGRATHDVSEFFSIDDNGCFRYSDSLLGQFQELAPWPENRELFTDLAASVQAALQHGVLHLARRARELSGQPRLCYAGGVALNSVANERVLAETGFDDVYMMPAAEDSGTAIGAAYYGLRALRGTPPSTRRAGNDSVGHRYTRAEIDTAIASAPHVETSASDDVLDTAVSLLCDRKIIGWFEGGSELGPRALGQRSILCDPRRADGKDVLNERVKYRESFRPFAPVILREEMERWFEVAPNHADSPYMLRVCKLTEPAKARVPAVVHVDGTGRVQTITPDANRLLYQLVARFHQRTGVPLLLNTSFNRAGEPIVETPGDALWCLLGTGLDALVFDHVVVRKAADFHSLLQLYPHVTARLSGDDAMTVATPYGMTTTRLPGSDRHLLTVCDGSCDGFSVLDAFARISTQPIDEAYVARRLYHLRRLGIIELRAEPVS
jgi:carbamoyltransferase